MGEWIGNLVGIDRVLRVLQRGCVVETGCSAEDLQVATERVKDIETGNKVGMESNPPIISRTLRERV